MYDSEDDAVDKIAATLADAAEQQRLLRILVSSSGQFTAARFMQQVRDIVDNFQA
jgi:hypothetical protein